MGAPQAWILQKGVAGGSGHHHGSLAGTPREAGTGQVLAGSSPHHKRHVPGPLKPCWVLLGEGTLEERGALAECCEAQATSVPSRSFLEAKGPTHTMLSPALLPSPALTTTSWNPSPRRPYVLPGLLPALQSLPVRPPSAVTTPHWLLASALALKFGLHTVAKAIAL